MTDKQFYKAYIKDRPCISKKHTRTEIKELKYYFTFDYGKIKIDGLDI